ncbi:MAG: hypothetical protein QT11_C0001G0635 [archaeon GW2011_AR20]|nr:MAG: hypothetical protein QT11_C0001G0635 [archaeon GW2011_AR20]MBS3160906.1 hypothetical protein [Candidatus Woesearchaeota archaeon]
MEKEIQSWMEKVKGKEFDLSKQEDLSIALMNLISLEEHFYFSSMKTGNKAYLDMLNSVRTLRKSLLKKIVKNPKGEEWCISKHLLASSMRLIEVGTKELQDNEKEAEMYFKSAFELYSLFFAINLNIIEVKEIKGEKSLFTRKISDIVKKIVDCCKE